MKARMRIAVFGAAAVALACGSVFAQVGLSEVQGTVVDSDGNPIIGAAVTLKNTTNSALEFSAKTNKKGLYFIPNLIYNEPGEWNVTVEAAGYSPSKIDFESRKSDRTLVQEFETGMTAEAPQLVVIKAFGKATIDFTMMTAEQQAEHDLHGPEHREQGLHRRVAKATPSPIGSTHASQRSLSSSSAFSSRAAASDSVRQSPLSASGSATSPDISMLSTTSTARGDSFGSASSM